MVSQVVVSLLAWSHKTIDRLKHFVWPVNNVSKNFSKCSSGNTALLFSMLLFPIISAIGMSVDYAQAVKARSAMQNALDTAILAAGRTLQTTGDVSESTSVAHKHFDTVLANADFSASLSNTTIDPSTGNLSFSASGSVNTSFMSIVGMNTISINVSNAAELALGGEGEKNVEISMMLDVTGSMSGEKLSDLKVAAKDLVQIVMQGNQGSTETTRVALVPFSESVNLDTYASSVVGTVPATKSVYNYWYGYLTYYLASKCVSERTGTNAFTDEAPSSGNYMGAVYSYYGTCKPANDELVPLTSDKTVLDNTIDGLYATGGTAGHLGTAWAWYTLSPKWNSIWPAASQPASYDDENVLKIAVLMTDGVYNRQYNDGVSSSSSPNGSSNTQARTLCENMKSAGITVYTVGFELTSSSAITTMQQCATSDDHYFLAEDGEQLKQVFREIAFQIAKLRLTQ